MKIKEILEARSFFIEGVSKTPDKTIGKTEITETNGCPTKSKGMEDEEVTATISPKILAKMQDKLAKRDVVASIDALRDFLEDNETPRVKRLIPKLVKLGYDVGEGLDGNVNFFKDLGLSRAAVEKVNIDETEEKETMVRCPVCKTMVDKEDLDDHVDEHEMKRPVKKMKKMEEGKKEDKEENLGDEGLLPKKVGKEIKKKHQEDKSDKKFKKEYSPMEEAKEVLTDLDSRQKSELVDHMKELLSTKMVTDPSEAAHLSLEDVSGFEMASDAVKKKVVAELLNLYKKTLKK